MCILTSFPLLEIPGGWFSAPDAAIYDSGNPQMQLQEIITIYHRSGRVYIPNRMLMHLNRVNESSVVTGSCRRNDCVAVWPTDVDEDGVSVRYRAHNKSWTSYVLTFLCNKHAWICSPLPLFTAEHFSSELEITSVYTRTPENTYHTCIKVHRPWTGSRLPTLESVDGCRPCMWNVNVGSWSIIKYRIYLHNRCQWRRWWIVNLSHVQWAATCCLAQGHLCKSIHFPNWHVFLLIQRVNLVTFLSQTCFSNL